MKTPQAVALDQAAVLNKFLAPPDNGARNVERVQ
jgi:hypothetical protein